MILVCCTCLSALAEAKTQEMCWDFVCLLGLIGFFGLEMEICMVLMTGLMNGLYSGKFALRSDLSRCFFVNGG